MTNESVCPFYGRNREFCDVGCGLVTAREADLIIRHCASHFGDCPRYLDVVARHSAKVSGAHRKGVRSVLAGVNSGGRKKVFSTDHPAPIAHFVPFVEEDKGMNAQVEEEISPAAVALDAETPSPVGLLGFAMTVILLNLHYSGLFSINPIIFGMGIFYGGLGQVVIGLMEWRKGSLFGATVFVAFGLFWLSLIALLVFPAAGWGKPPQAVAMAAYFAMWGIFSTIIFLGALRISRAMRVVFGTLALTFFLFSAAGITGIPAIRTVAGIIGMGCGLSAFYVGINLGIHEVRNRRAMPMGASAN
jgi:uncharacterized protein